MEDLRRADRCIQTPKMSLLQTTRHASIFADTINSNKHVQKICSLIRARGDNLAKADACTKAAHLPDGSVGKGELGIDSRQDEEPTDAFLSGVCIAKPSELLDIQHHGGKCTAS